MPFPEAMAGTKHNLDSAKGILAKKKADMQEYLNEYHSDRVLYVLSTNPMLNSDHIEKMMSINPKIAGFDQNRLYSALAGKASHKMQPGQMHRIFDSEHSDRWMKVQLLSNLTDKDVDVPEDLQMKYAKLPEHHDILVGVRNITKDVIKAAIKHSPAEGNMPLSELSYKKPHLWDETMIHDALKKSNKYGIHELVQSPVVSSKSLEYSWDKLKGKDYYSGDTIQTALHTILNHPNVSNKVLKSALKHDTMAIRHAATKLLNR